MGRIPTAMLEPPPLDPHVPAPPPRSRHALLVNPFYAKDPHSSFGKHVLTPTLALTSLAGATPDRWTVSYWDENLLQGPPPLDPMPQVVGITVHLTFARRAYELARWFRARGATVVLGGLHALSCPEEVRPHADVLAIGEGTQVWPEILHDFEKGSLKGEYRGSYARPYREDPPPRRRILDHQAYLTTTSLIATRGCHNRCGFCYLATDGLHMPYRTRETRQVVDEILADDRPYSVFIDNNLGSCPGYLRELCRAIRPLQKIWTAAVTIDVADDPSLVREMALAGCTGVFIGFETLTDENLRASRKQSPAPDDYARRVRLFHDHGIEINGSFVLGFDHDGPDVFERTFEWIQNVRLACATFHILTPYPGTPLFRRYEAEGRLLHKDWDRYDTAHVVFRPKRMSVERLAEGYAWIYRKLFSHRAIWQRRPRKLSALPAYLAGGYLYKKANWLWPFLIRHRLVARVWHPLVELSRLRHVRFRRKLAERLARAARAPGHVVSPGV